MSDLIVIGYPDENDPTASTWEQPAASAGTPA